MVLDELAYFNGMSYPELLMHKYLPLLNRREYFNKYVENKIQELTGFITGIVSTDHVIDLMSETFEDKNMNSDLLHERQLADELANDEYKTNMIFRPEKHSSSISLKFVKNRGFRYFSLE